MDARILQGAAVERIHLGAPRPPSRRLEESGYAARWLRSTRESCRILHAHSAAVVVEGLARSACMPRRRFSLIARTLRTGAGPGAALGFRTSDSPVLHRSDNAAIRPHEQGFIDNHWNCERVVILVSGRARAWRSNWVRSKRRVVPQPPPQRRTEPSVAALRTIRRPALPARHAKDARPPGLP